MSPDKMPLGQNVTGKIVTWTKCHRTKHHQDKMSLGQNATGINIGILGMNVIRTKCDQRKCNNELRSTIFIFFLTKQQCTRECTNFRNFFFKHETVEMTTKDL